MQAISTGIKLKHHFFNDHLTQRQGSSKSQVKGGSKMAVAKGGAAAADGPAKAR